MLCNVDLSQKWGDYTRLFSLMDAFSKLGNNVTMLVIRPEYKKPNVSYFKEHSLDVIEIHPPTILKIKGKRGIGKYLNYAACQFVISNVVSKLVKKNKIDCVYSYMPGIGSSFPAERLKSKYKIKFILDFADLHVFVRPRFIVDSAFKNADEIVVITNYLQNELIKKGIAENRIHIIPNGVDLELFNPDRYDKTEIQKLRDTFQTNNLVVFSGALQDLNIIIDSAHTVIESIPDVKYVILGDHRDPNRSKTVWEYKVKEKGLDAHFVFLGRKPREDVPKYLLCADVCLDSFPNEPYYAAAHPVKLLEYGACAKPVVATRVSETEKIVKHGTYGFLADPNKPQEFANYLIKLLDSKQLCVNMGKEFSLFIRDNFDWNKIAINLSKVIK